MDNVKIISDKIKECTQELNKQNSYVTAATNGIKTLRQELKRAYANVAKLEGAIEAYSISVRTLEENSQVNTGEA